MSLVTRKKLRRKKQKELLVPDLVINRVHYIAERQKQSQIAREKPVFSTTRHGNEFNNTNKLVNDERIEDNDSTASEKDEKVIDAIENDITNLIDRYNEVEEIYNQETTIALEEVTLEEWVR